VIALHFPSTRHDSDSFSNVKKLLSPASVVQFVTWSVSQNDDASTEMSIASDAASGPVAEFDENRQFLMNDGRVHDGRVLNPIAPARAVDVHFVKLHPSSTNVVVMIRHAPGETAVLFCCGTLYVDVQLSKRVEWSSNVRDSARRAAPFGWLVVTAVKEHCFTIRSPRIDPIAAPVWFEVIFMKWTFVTVKSVVHDVMHRNPSPPARSVKVEFAMVNVEYDQTATIGAFNWTGRCSGPAIEQFSIDPWETSAKYIAPAEVAVELRFVNVQPEIRANDALDETWETFTRECPPSMEVKLDCSIETEAA
jgi:hypothetical protein